MIEKVYKFIEILNTFSREQQDIAVNFVPGINPFLDEPSSIFDVKKALEQLKEEVNKVKDDEVKHLSNDALKEALKKLEELHKSTNCKELFEKLKVFWSDKAEEENVDGTVEHSVLSPSTNVEGIHNNIDNLSLVNVESSLKKQKLKQVHEFEQETLTNLFGGPSSSNTNALPIVPYQPQQSAARDNIIGKYQGGRLTFYILNIKSAGI
uniref:Uncharacterized protein n=1 Tax=Meloidogyne hapla TaxID=6305 RepID=A0A1I8BPL0_MELHA